MDSSGGKRIMRKKVLNLRGERAKKGFQDTKDHLYLHSKCVWVDSGAKTTLVLSMEKVNPRS